MEYANPFEPRTLRQAIDDMGEQRKKYEIYKKGMGESYATEEFKRLYLRSREAAIKLGGLNSIKNFPERLK